MQIIRDDKKYVIGISGVDAKGNPAVLDPTDPPVLSVSDESMASISQQADGSFLLEPSGKLGSFQLQCQDDGLTALEDIQVVAGPAVSLGISLSEAPSA